MRADHSDLADALERIDPAALTYSDWEQVGMALHESGLPCSLWESWSRRDPARFREGECERKWRGFGHGAAKVGSGTIVKMARDRGWQPGGKASRPARALSWDEEITPMLRASLIESAPIPHVAKRPAAAQLLEYLEALFEPDEYVGYVTAAEDNGKKLVPADRGVYTRTAGDIERALRGGAKLRDALFSELNDAAGAWIRPNPLDGKGVGNANVAAFRYALVESDTLPKEKQWAVIQQLKLPCAAVVDSGGKSVHAVVRVDANDAGEYRERVEKLYEILASNGFEIDAQNKNPSRLSRMPGAARGGSAQELLATNIGCRTWAEWIEWYKAETDELPDFESLADVWGNMPPLAPELIGGVLRQGHKMLVAGPSKAGKTFALVELCIAIAGGREWLGFPCARGKVIYVNLEVDTASCWHRFREIYKALGIEPTPEELRNIDVWNLRGCAAPLDKLAPSLIRRALKAEPMAIVIDPLYKILTGDENNASEMAAFCNQFDKVAREVGCAVIYCHHHSKGAQGGKRSMDRASGSGVFARDPDALLDLSPLKVDEAAMAEATRALRFEKLRAVLDERFEGWRKACANPENDAEVVKWANEKGGEVAGSVRAAWDAAGAESQAWTAWRVEGTLREFPAFGPRDVWFRYPVHEVDGGALSKCRVEGDDEPPEKASGREPRAKAGKPARADAHAEKVAALRQGIGWCEAEGVEPTRANVLERMPEVGGKKPTLDDVRSWTRGCKWSPVTMDGAGVLVDSGAAK
jgi:regulatory protein RepA